MSSKDDAPRAVLAGWVDTKGAAHDEDAPHLFDVLKEACERYINEGVMPESALLAALCRSWLDVLHGQPRKGRKPGRAHAAAEHAERMRTDYLAAGLDPETALVKARKDASRVWNEPYEKIASAHRLLSRKKTPLS